MKALAAQPIQIGIDSFVSAVADPATGLTMGPVERMRNLLEEVERADEVGLDAFGVGEHHRREFFDSAPAVILAAAAARTKQIRLNSAVSVLGADDPVRVFQSFATLDLISGGRAEMVVGRGSFIEAFPLFGLDLDDYDSLFAEKLDLLLQIRDNPEHVQWSGKYRPALTGQGVYPRRVQTPLPIWLGVGDTPPFRAPVFVVTHRPRPTLQRHGGTSFTYVTDGVASAIEQARAAADGKNVAIAGGGTLLRQVIKLGLLDELELHIVPVILGDGLRL